MIGRFNFVHGDPARVDEAIGVVKSTVQPVIDAQPGSYGLGLWANRQTGDALLLSVWADRESLDASESNIAPVRQAVAGLIDAPPVVENYEAVIVDRAGPDEVGDIMRVLHVTGSPDDIEANTVWVQEEILPFMRQQEGYLGYVVALDHVTGRGLSMATFRGRDNADRALAASELLREVGAARGLNLGEELEYEVAFVGIRGPQDEPPQRTIQLPTEAKI